MYKEMYTVREDIHDVGANRELSGAMVEDLDRLGTTGLEYNLEWAESTYTVYLRGYEVLTIVDRDRLEEFFKGEHNELAVKHIAVEKLIKDSLNKLFAISTIAELEPKVEFINQVFKQVIKNGLGTKKEYKELIEDIIHEEFK